MARRLGIYSLQKLATKMCAVLAWATPVLVSEFPTNDTLQAALAAANAACGILNTQLEIVREKGD